MTDTLTRFLAFKSVLGRGVAVLAVAGLAVFMPFPAAYAVPGNFINEAVVDSGLFLPTMMEFLPDGRMLVGEFNGDIMVVQSGASAPDPAPFLHIDNMFGDDIVAGGERGLVGMTLDPNFASNGFFYVFYTAKTPQRDRVSRFTAVGNSVNTSTELVLWQGVGLSDQTDHHGGGLVFGPDGKLYLTTGDNGNPPSVQSLTSDHGKILRINPDGTIPSDNPFFDGAGPNIDSIWALGLRNPYRIFFDPPTGKMYIGDVGQNTVEEINIGVAGANYGWPTCEGSCGVAGMTNPIHSYNHNGRDASVTGGVVYHASQFPSQYQNVYFFGDYAQNWIKYLTFNANGSVENVVNFEPTDGTLDGPYGDPVEFKVGPDGSLYYVDFGFDASNPAAIRRIRYVLGNQPPTAVLTANPTQGVPPLDVNFSAASSTDPENQPLSYLWTFGDGVTSTLVNPMHTYTGVGNFSARVAVSDGTNTVTSSPVIIAVGNRPTATITAPTNGATFVAGDVITFSGTATDTEDGTLAPSAFSWTVLFHHDSHVHPFITVLTGTTTGSFAIPSSGHTFEGATNYEIILTVTDSNGLQDTKSVTVFPQKVNVTFTTAPSGLTLLLDGVSKVTSFVVESLVGFQFSISAPNQSPYVFSTWSDLGAQTHTITVPNSDATLTATFVQQGDPSLLIAYGLNETFGTVAEDMTANNKDATLVNGPVWAAGKYGNGIALDGVNDYLQTLNPALPTGDYTWEAWVKANALTGFDAMLRAGADAEVEFTVYTGSKLGIWSNDVLRITSAGTIPVSTWTHVALTRQGSTLRTYINGVQDSVTASDGVAYDFAGCPLLIGVDSDSGCTGLLNGYLNGSLDEIRIYNRALSQTEIQTDMITPIAPPAPDTTPPVRSNGAPTSSLPAGTTQTQISLATDEVATCRYATTTGVAYSAMTNTFSATASTSHTTTVTGLSDGGTYTYYVRCIDASSNANPDDFSISFSVLTDTTAPVISNVATSGHATSTVTVTWTTNEASDSEVEYGTSTAYGQTSTLNPSLVTNHSVGLTGLAPATLYHYRVRSKDAASNLASSTDGTFATLSGSDTILPTVTLTAPSNGTTASNTITLAATASDNVGVTKVEFYANGVLKGTDTSTPYAVSLDTATLSNGAYSLQAKAYDAANNVGTSLLVSITVSNTAALPAISPNGGTFTGSVTVTLTSSTTGASIRYTTNNTTPNGSSTLYTAPFVLTTSSTVRAIAIKSGMNTSAVASATFVINPTAPGLVNAFSFNEGTGTTVTDSSANHNVGTLTNGPAWVTGKYGNGLSFDGTNDYVSVASPDLPTGNYTWSAWIKPNALTGYDAIFRAGSTAEFELAAFTANKLAVWSNDVRRLTTNTALSVAAWTHVAVTRSSNTIRVYINGVQDSVTGTDNGSYNFNSCPLLIAVDSDSGCTGLLNGYWNGLIDEVRIYNRALSAAEIQSDMNAPLP